MSLPLLELWYTAARAKIGIIVATDEPERMRVYLYKARKEAGDPAIADLSVFTSPTLPGELWITHKVIETQTEADALREDLKNV